MYIYMYVITKTCIATIYSVDKLITSVIIMIIIIISLGCLSLEIPSTITYTSS